MIRKKIFKLDYCRVVCSKFGHSCPKFRQLSENLIFCTEKIILQNCECEAAKKFFLSGQSTKRGGGKGLPLRKKELFLMFFFLFVAVEKLNI